MEAHVTIKAQRRQQQWLHLQAVQVVQLVKVWHTQHKQITTNTYNNSLRLEYIPARACSPGQKALRLLTQLRASLPLSMCTSIGHPAGLKAGGGAM